MTRALALIALLAACRDYDHFSRLPGDLAVTSAADLAGCPALGALPIVRPGCTLYQFDQGVPPALELINPQGATSACNMLHVLLPAGPSHDLWIDNLDSFRVQEKSARSGAFSVTASIHGALDATQKFTGVYALDGSDRFISVQTSMDDSGLHDHDVVFSFGAGSAEQASYPNATPGAGDSYVYSVARGPDTNFVLQGSSATTLMVTASSALTLGAVVGNCCDPNAPAFEAWIEWLMVCQ